MTTGQKLRTSKIRILAFFMLFIGVVLACVPLVVRAAPAKSELGRKGIERVAKKSNKPTPASSILRSKPPAQLKKGSKYTGRGIDIEFSADGEERGYIGGFVRSSGGVPLDQILDYKNSDAGSFLSVFGSAVASPGYALDKWTCSASPSWSSTSAKPTHKEIAKAARIALKNNKNFKKLAFVARFRPLVCKITFDPNFPNSNKGKSSAETPSELGIKLEVDYGKDIEIPDNYIVKSPDYRFLGWNTKANGKGGTLYKPGDTIKKVKDHTKLYAQWKKRVAYTDHNIIIRFIVDETKGVPLNFPYSGDHAIYLSEVLDYETLAKKHIFFREGPHVGVVAREGYEFENWTCQAGPSWSSKKPRLTARDLAEAAEAAIEHNKDFVNLFFIANFRPKVYKITFDANVPNEERASIKPLKKLEVKYNEDIKIPDGYSLTRAGYRFLGWNTKADGKGGTPYMPKDTIKNVKGHMTLYAQWKMEEKVKEKVTLTYKSEDDTKGTVSRSSEEVVVDSNSVQGCTATPQDGYEFVKWTRDTDSSWSHTQATLTKKAIEDSAKKDGKFVPTTYTAHFKPKFYKITFDVNVPDKEKALVKTPNGLEVSHNKDIKIPDGYAPKRAGYRFLGWNTKADGKGGALYKPEDTIKNVKSHLTLYAQWKKRPNNAHLERSITMKFVVDDESRGAIEYVPGATRVPRAPLYLILDHKSAAHMNILFFLNGASAKDGHAFEKWTCQTSPSWLSKKKRPSYREIAEAAEDTLERNKDFTELVFTAHFRPEICKITFDANVPGNEKASIKVPTEQTVGYNKDIKVPDYTPTRAGYDFLGWNTKADGKGGTPYMPKDTIKNVKDHMTLYAQWKMKENKGGGGGGGSTGAKPQNPNGQGKTGGPTAEGGNDNKNNKPSGNGSQNPNKPNQPGGPATEGGNGNKNNKPAGNDPQNPNKPNQSGGPTAEGGNGNKNNKPAGNDPQNPNKPNQSGGPTAEGGNGNKNNKPAGNKPQNPNGQGKTGGPTAEGGNDNKNNKPSGNGSQNPNKPNQPGGPATEGGNDNKNNKPSGNGSQNPNKPNQSGGPTAEGGNGNKNKKPAGNGSQNPNKPNQSGGPTAEGGNGNKNNKPAGNDPQNPNKPNQSGGPTAEGGNGNKNNKPAGNDPQNPNGQGKTGGPTAEGGNDNKNNKPSGNGSQNPNKPNQSGGPATEGGNGNKNNKPSGNGSQNPNKPNQPGGPATEGGNDNKNNKPSGNGSQNPNKPNQSGGPATEGGNDNKNNKPSGNGSQNPNKPNQSGGPTAGGGNGNKNNKPAGNDPQNPNKPNQSGGPTAGGGNGNKNNKPAGNDPQNPNGQGKTGGPATEGGNDNKNNKPSGNGSQNPNKPNQSGGPATEGGNGNKNNKPAGNDPQNPNGQGKTGGPATEGGNDNKNNKPAGNDPQNPSGQGKTGGPAPEGGNDNKNNKPSGNKPQNPNRPNQFGGSAPKGGNDNENNKPVGNDSQNPNRPNRSSGPAPEGGNDNKNNKPAGNDSQNPNKPNQSGGPAPEGGNDNKNNKPAGKEIHNPSKPVQTGSTDTGNKASNNTDTGNKASNNTGTGNKASNNTGTGNKGNNSSTSTNQKGNNKSNTGASKLSNDSKKGTNGSSAIGKGRQSSKGAQKGAKLGKRRLPGTGDNTSLIPFGLILLSGMMSAMAVMFRRIRRGA